MPKFTTAFCGLQNPNFGEVSSIERQITTSATIICSISTLEKTLKGGLVCFGKIEKRSIETLNDIGILVRYQYPNIV
jgi:hypothetical protein